MKDNYEIPEMNVYRKGSKAQNVATAVVGLLTGVGIYTVVDWIVSGVKFLASLFWPLILM